MKNIIVTLSSLLSQFDLFLSSSTNAKSVAPTAITYDGVVVVVVV